MSRFTVLCVDLVIVIALSITQSNCIFAQTQDEQLAVIAKTTAEKTTAESKEKTSSKSKSWERYLVTVAEYRLKDIGPSELTTEGITAAIKEQKASPVEAVMLSATEGNESKVSIGRTVTVTTGKTTARERSSSRNTQRVELGTILSVKIMPDGDQVKAELSFTASRHLGEGTDDSPPEIVSAEIDTAQLFDLGQPTLIAASTGNGSYYVLLTITRR